MYRTVLIFISICCIFSFSTVLSKDNNTFQKKEYIETLQADIERMPYDVLSYNLVIDISKALHDAEISKDTAMSTYFTGRQTITLKIDSTTSMIKLDAADMTIGNVTMESVKDGSIIFVKLKSGNNLFLTNPNGYTLDDTITLTIDYSVNRTTKIGLHLYPQGTYFAKGKDFVVEEPLVYTQSEYSWARYWMPCNDQPYDKALSSIAITVPEGYTAISNGELVFQTTDSKDEFNTETFYWDFDSPISTYLMTVNASKFTLYEQKYPRYTNDQDTLVIKNYCWQIDLDAPEEHLYDAKFRLKEQPEILRFFSSVFGEYPYSSYGTVLATPYRFGGMEHTTMVLYDRDWILKSEDLSSGFAHEIAHQWLGDLITCATWGDLWINEGAAMWCEAIWEEHFNNSKNAYYNNTVGMLNYYIEHEIEVPVPIYGLSGIQLEEYNFLPYDKGGFVYHMLSDIIGREKFYGVLKAIFEENQYAVLTIEDFKELIKAKVKETKLNMDLDIFFDEWLFDSGYIKYALHSAQLESAEDVFKYEIKVEQTQTGEGYREVFTMPIDIVFVDSDDNEIQRETVFNDSRVQSYTFELSQPFSKAYVDSSLVLCQNILQATNVDDKNISQNIQISPNPVKDILNISHDNDIDLLNSKISIVNLKGETIKSLNLVHHQQQIDVSNLASGTYILVIETANKKVTNKFVKF